MPSNQTPPNLGTTSVPQPSRAANTTVGRTTSQPDADALTVEAASAAAEAAAHASSVSRYRPRTVPDELREQVTTLVRAWVSETLPCSRRAASMRLHTLTGLLVWCHEQGITLRPDTVLRDATIERYVATALVASAGSSRATLRSALRVVAAELLPRQRLTPPPAAHGAVAMKPPYSPAEVTGLLNLAAAQSTCGRATNVTAALLAGLGAGLDGGELGRARGSWVRRDGHDVVVDIGGTRPRTVPVLSRYSEALLAAADRVGDGWLLGGTDLKRGNRFSNLAAALTAGSDVPHLSSGRLRATWMLTLVSAQVRVDLVCRAAGLADPRLLVFLFPHLPGLTNADGRAAVAGRGVRR